MPQLTHVGDGKDARHRHTPKYTGEGVGVQRWTIRNVRADVIRAVQALSADSGVCLGEIVSACIELGLDQVRARFLSAGADSDPAPKIERGLDEIFRSIKMLSVGLPSTSSK